MSVPIMLIFDARAVLCRQGTQFTGENFAGAAVACGETDDFFRSIEFDKIYHDGVVSDPDLRAELKKLGWRKYSCLPSYLWTAC